MDNNRNTPEKKGAKKPLDQNLITIIIAAVTVVVLIALLIPTIIALNKNGEKVDDFKAQLDEMKDRLSQIEVTDSVTAEELQNAISDAIAGIKIPEGGLTEEQVKAIIDAAIAGIKIPEGGLTEEQVKAIIDAAIAGIDMPAAGLTEEQVKDIIDAALEGLDTGLTEEQIRDIIEDVINSMRPEEVPPTFEESITTGQGVTLEADTTLSESVHTPVDSKMTIDLGGNVLVIDENTTFDVYGTLDIINGFIVVEATLSDELEAQGIIVKDSGALNLENVVLTMAGSSAYGIANEGSVTIRDCDFVVGEDATGLNCLIYNEGKMTVIDTTITEEVSPVEYAYGAPVHNRGTLDMINVEIESSGFCTSSFGGKITIDSESILTLTGEKNLTPDGDYFAYNVHNFDEPTSNDCSEFKYLGEAEVNQINIDFKELFANGGTITLTEDAEVGTAFAAMSGKGITVDLGGNTLTLNENAYVIVSTDFVTFKNGTLIVETDSDDKLQCFDVLASGTLSINGIDFINSSTEMYAIDNEGKLYVSNSDFSIPTEKLGASLTFVYNLGTAEISDSTFGNTAPEAKYTRCTPIDNYGKLAMTGVEVNSLSCCVYVVGNDSTTLAIDCTFNCGEDAAAFCTLAVNEGCLEDDVITNIVDGVAVEAPIFYH